MTLEIVETTTGTLEVVETSTRTLEIVEIGIQGPPGITGPQGEQGPPGTGGAFAYAFSWGDATPAVIMIAAPLTTIIKTEVVLLTPFNAEAHLSIGDSGNHESLLAAADIDLAVAGTYQSNVSKICAGSTALNLYLTLVGLVSAGNGIIFIYF